MCALFAYAPWWPGMIVVLMALVGGVVPNEQDPEPTREQLVDAQVVETLRDMKTAVSLRDSKRYLRNFSSELQKEVAGDIDAVLNSPKRHCLVMRSKCEAVSVSSYEAVYRVKIVMESLCETGYRSNTQYATVTFSPDPDAAPGSEDSQFFSNGGNNDPSEMKWKVTKWKTEKVVPYDRDRDN